MDLGQLLQQRRDLWRGGQQSAARPTVPTGFPELDGRLVGGGWPAGAVTEILGEGLVGSGLLLPALARLSGGARWLVCVAFPCLPYAPALAAAGIDLGRLLVVSPHAADAVPWALEQALRSGACSLVLGWLPRAEPALLRRLQLAAEAVEAAGILFRPAAAAAHPSPAALKLAVRPAEPGWWVEVLKQRGGWGGAALRVEGPGEHAGVSHAVAGAALSPAAP
jgi:hypothetical protein